MITIEELIIQSLYYRLVVINVKKQPTDGASSSSSTGQDHEMPYQEGSSVDPEFLSERQTVRDCEIQERQSESPRSGLGKLVMGACSGNGADSSGQRPIGAASSHGGKPSIEGGMGTHPDAETDAVIDALVLANSQEFGDPDIEFTEEVKTILRAGNLKLKRAMLKTSDHTTESVPIWYFGPEDSSPQVFQTSPTEEEAEEGDGEHATGDGEVQKSSLTMPHQRKVPVVDLNKCDQFSILQIQDLRHPERKNLVMIQTPETTSTAEPQKETQKQAASRGPRVEHSLDNNSLSPPVSHCSSSSSPMPSPLAHCDSTSVFHKPSALSPIPTARPSGEQPSVFQEHEIDSGIWDLHGHDSLHSTQTSTRESTPVVSMNSSMTEHSEPSVARTLFSAAMGSQVSGGSDAQPHVPLHMSRKIYTVEENLNSAVLESVQVASRRFEGKTPRTTSEGMGEEQPLGAAQDLMLGMPPGDYDTKSFFTETPEAMRESYACMEQLRLGDWSQQIGTDPAESHDVIRDGLNELHNLVLNDQNGQIDNIIDFFSTGDNTENKESHTFGNDSETFKQHTQPAGLRDDDGVLRRYASPLRVEVTEPGIDLSKHRKFLEDDTLTTAQRASQHAIVHSRHVLLPSPKHSPRKQATPSHSSAQMLGDPMQCSPGSEYERSPDACASLDSPFNWDSSDDSMVSSLSTVSEVMPQSPPFERFMDWMGNLPSNLQHVPLSCLTIPGSHISMAIDRDMRADMDFSKCNYEMAEFLRKLPNLNVFNNFRSLMKRIWRAWMPKQRLNITEQLEAGVRYLDMHVTIYRGAFYAEHGLYTKQFKKYLREIKDFCDVHSREVVIIHFASLDQLGKSDKRRLVTVLFQVFGARLSKVVSPEQATLHNFWQSKKQFMIIFPRSDMEDLRNHIFGGLIWSDEVLQTIMPKKESVTQLISHLKDVYEDKCLKQDDNRMHLLRAVLSPDMSMVFGEYQFKSMRELTRQKTNLAVCDWLNRRRNLNIVAVDFVECTGVVGKIIQLNTGALHHEGTETTV